MDPIGNHCGVTKELDAQPVARNARESASTASSEIVLVAGDLFDPVARHGKKVVVVATA